MRVAPKVSPVCSRTSSDVAVVILPPRLKSPALVKTKLSSVATVPAELKKISRSSPAAAEAPEPISS